MNFQPKALLLAANLAFAGAAAPSAAHAQVAVNVQFGHPTWGPVAPAGAQYYYVPEIDGYYDLQAQDYIVQRGGRWAHYRTLPGYDPRNFHPVVVDYRGRQPWDGYQDHHTRYYRQPGPGPQRGPGNSDFGHAQGRGHGHDDHGRGHR